MPPKKEKEPAGAQCAVRLENEVIARLDKLAAKLSRPGLQLTRADAIRICLAEALPRLEREDR